MSVRGGSRIGALVVAVLAAWGGIANAQTSTPAQQRGGWVLGVSGGLWGRVPTTEDPHHNATAADVIVERRLGSSSNAAALSLHAQMGTGSGRVAGGPGFDYDRFMLGVTRPFVGASRAPFMVYLGAGGGAYAERFSHQRRTRPSVYGALGLDVSLGASAVSVGGEVQVHSIGARVYGTTSLGARVHFH